MKQIWIVFLYTLKDGARKKAFKISTGILLVLILGACLILHFTGSGEPATEETLLATEIAGTETAEAGADAAEPSAPSETEPEGLCYYIDEKNALPGGLQALQAALPEIQFETASAAQIDQYRSQIAEDADLSMIIISPAEDTSGLAAAPLVQIINKDFMSGLGSGEVGDVLTRQFITNQLKAQGIEGDISQMLNLQLTVSSEIAGEMDLSGYILGIVITMLMFFAIYYYGYGVSMSIATEKTSRVMETLVVSAKPSRILIGKCLGMGVLGLLQFGGVILFTALCYHFLVPADFTIMGMPLSLSSFTLTRGLIILAYFILGYSLYAVMNAVCGASVSKIEDINAAMMPVVLIAMISFYIGYFAAISGSGADSLLQKIAIYIPFCSPFIVPFKILNGDVPAMDIVLSMGALVLAIVIIAAVSIRIYTASVLHYGDRLKLKDMFKLKA